MTKILHHYGQEFNLKSARIILPYLKTYHNFNSVVDVGCGLGTWLYACDELGISNILGIDGAHVLDTGELLISKDSFVKFDFENQIGLLKLDSKYDLTICLEVAEHIKASQSEAFVNFLTSTSDVILFSAAMPGQTGENHQNEQFPDYWAELFSRLNFMFLDPFREKFWRNSDIEWWYRQNMFLIVNRDIRNRFSEMKEWNGNVYIIPEMITMYVNRFDTKNSDLSKYSFFNNLFSRIIRKIKRLFT